MSFQMIHMEIAYRVLERSQKIHHSAEFILGTVAPDAVHMAPVYKIEEKVSSHLFEGCGEWSNTQDYQRWDQNIKDFYRNIVCDAKDPIYHDFLLGICVHCLTDYRNDVRIWNRLQKYNVPPMEFEVFRNVYYQEANGIDQWLYQNSTHREEIREMLLQATSFHIPGMVEKVNLDKQREHLLNVQYADTEKIEVSDYQFLNPVMIESFIETAVTEIIEKLEDWDIVFPYQTSTASIALELPDHYVWDCSVLKAEGKYHMFSSRWRKELGFGWNWVFHSEIIHSVSDQPQGPYRFENVVLPRRGRQYFDGMNTHNTCIKEYQGKYYLYYMGSTYSGEVPDTNDKNYYIFAQETWNRKRIGIAVADNINGPFIRREKPLLEPRDCSFWDCTITTNPSVIILNSGKTYLIYKSRQSIGKPLQLGIAVADRPDGEFVRLTEKPILQFEDENLHIEDPFIWYDEEREKFCLIAKDDSKNGSFGITGEWGSGFYAESDDCIHFEIAKEPKVYSRKVTWEDGSSTWQGNLERPSLLFDEMGKPTHLFCASGYGDKPYTFDKNTFVVCIKLEEKQNNV